MYYVIKGRSLIWLSQSPGSSQFQKFCQKIEKFCNNYMFRIIEVLITCGNRTHAKSRNGQNLNFLVPKKLFWIISDIHCRALFHSVQPQKSNLRINPKNCNQIQSISDRPQSSFNCQSPFNRPLQISSYTRL